MAALDPKLLVGDVKEVMRRRIQHFLDKTVPHTPARWLGFLVTVLIYWLRVYTKGSHYIVTYGLGIYILNLFVGFITPPVRWI
jgi:Rer1 family